MSPEEVYEELLQILRDQNLNWVVEEIQQQVLIGRTDMKKVQAVVELEDSRRHQLTLYNLADNDERSGRSAEYITSIQYSPEEKLHLLIDSIEQVTVNLTDIKRSAWSLLSVHGNVQSINILDTQSGSHSHQLDGEDIQHSSQVEEAIKQVIHLLRGI